jgi:hypothetical protein
MLAAGFFTIGLSSVVVPASLAREAASPTAPSGGMPRRPDLDEVFTVLELDITVDSQGLLERSDQARRDAVAALDPLLAPYAACAVEFGMIFGGGTGQKSIDTASLIAELLYLHFTDLLSDRATFGRLSLNDPAAIDEVDLTLFFQKGCDPISGTGTPAPAAGSAAFELRFDVSLTALGKPS